MRAIRMEEYVVTTSNLDEVKRLARGGTRVYMNGLALSTHADYIENDLAMIAPGDLVSIYYDNAEDVVTKLGEIADE